MQGPGETTDLLANNLRNARRSIGQGRAAFPQVDSGGGLQDAVPEWVKHGPELEAKLTAMQTASLMDKVGTLQMLIALLMAWNIVFGSLVWTGTIVNTDDSVTCDVSKCMTQPPNNSYVLKELSKTINETELAAYVAVDEALIEVEMSSLAAEISGDTIEPYLNYTHLSTFIDDTELVGEVGPAGPTGPAGPAGSNATCSPDQCTSGGLDCGGCDGTDILLAGQGAGTDGKLVVQADDSATHQATHGSTKGLDLEVVGDNGYITTSVAASSRIYIDPAQLVYLQGTAVYSSTRFTALNGIRAGSSNTELYNLGSKRQSITWTGVLSGSGYFTYVIAGNTHDVITFCLHEFTGVPSGAGTFSGTIWSPINGVTSSYADIDVVDNGTNQKGRVHVNGGTITIYADYALNGFTGSGTTGVYNTCFTVTES